MIRGQIKDLAFKHDTSRVVQTALKYGSKSIREEVAKELKGTYVSLSQSSYGKYLVVKVMHYGSPETRMSVAGEFIGHVKKLIRHREASFVIEDIYREYGTPEQKAQMVREFYGVEFAVFGKEVDADASLKKILEKNPEKRAVILKHMLDLLTAVVEKGAFFFTIVHRAMLEFVSNVAPGTTDATEFVELVKDHSAEVAFSKDGTQVMMRTLALGNAKVWDFPYSVLESYTDPTAGPQSHHQSREARSAPDGRTRNRPYAPPHAHGRCRRHSVGQQVDIQRISTKSPPTRRQQVRTDTTALPLRGSQESIDPTSSDRPDRGNGQDPRSHKVH